MTNYRWQEWSKRTERFQNDSQNTSVWDDSPEEEERELRQIKQKWQQKQNEKYNRIKQIDSCKKKTRNIVSTLITLMVIGVSAYYIPSLWKVTKAHIDESFSGTKSAILNQKGDTSPKKPSILERLKALEERSKTGNYKDDCVKTPTAVVCQSEQDDVNVNSNDGNSTIKDQVHQSIDQIHDYNQKLQQAIDISDGK